VSKMGTSCSFVSTFERRVLSFLLFLCLPAWANLEADHWIFHTAAKDYSFKREGDRRGTPLICIPEISKKLPLKISYNPEKFSLTFRKGKNYSRVWTYSSKVQGQVFVSAKPLDFETRLSIKPVFLGARLCLPTEAGDRVLRPVLESFPPDSLPVSQLSEPEAIDVIIDAGHGGNDFGAHRRISKAQHFMEKDFVLQMAKELRGQLENLGLKARLTRESDHFLTLPERAEIANHAQAKFFLSLHMNSSHNPKAHGYELYVLSLDQSDAAGRSAVARENQFIPADLPNWLEKAIADLRAEANLESSLQWARALDSGLKSQWKPSGKKSIQMGPFYILYGSATPAVLLELGYLTNPQDRSHMLNPLDRKSLAENLAKIISKQLKVPVGTR
jgi:N-acetylmuramoyl-L-alanine amidase